MGREHLIHAVEFIEAVERQIFNKSRAVDAAEKLFAIFVPLQGGPGIFHETQPEDIGAFNDHAVWPDLDPAIDFDGLPDDEPVDDAYSEQAGKIEPEVLNRRIMQQVPAVDAKRCCPCEETPERMPKVDVDILEDN